MYKMLRALVLLPVILLASCAHTIVISPKMDALPAANKTKINKNVGYYISNIDMGKKVQTPGGGDSRIEFMPYRDLESLFYTALANEYKGVYKLDAADNASEIKSKNISYVFVPKINTKSFSKAPTWQPTDFFVSFSTKIYDPNGKLVWHILARGWGHAKLEEIQKNPQVSAQRASEGVFINLQDNIRAAVSIH